MLISGTTGNDNIIGTLLDDIIDTGLGHDVIDASDGDDVVNAGNGDDVVAGGFGSDTLHGGNGHDTLYGGEGDDDLYGGNGNDIMTGGAGNHRLYGGNGNDTATYVLGQNWGFSDVYEGGNGSDTLRLELTSEDWQYESIRDDIRAFQSALDAGERTPYQFTAFGLSARGFEHLEVVVDGEVINILDEPAQAVTDEYGTSEDGIITGNVLDNDWVPDGVANVSLVGGFGPGELTLNSDGSFTYDPGDAFDFLSNDYEAGTRFLYQVTDQDGDTDTAYAYLFVYGLNEDPVANDDMAAASEDSTGQIINLLTNDTDIDRFDELAIASFDFSGLQGSVVDNGDGTVIYRPNGAFEALNAGETAIDSFTYTIADGWGGFDTAQVTIEIAGRNEGGPEDGLGDGNFVAAYLTADDPSGIPPIGDGSIDAAMDTAFGAGGWTKISNSLSDDVFRTADFIYLDGDYPVANWFELFIDANRDAMEDFVFKGGTMFINAASYEGDYNFDLGFDASRIPAQVSSTGTALDAAHPIFNGPNGSAGLNWSGNGFSLATVDGVGLTPLIEGEHGTVLAELSYGEGHVLFGGMLSPNIHTPTAEAEALRANILDYSASFSADLIA